MSTSKHKKQPEASHGKLYALIAIGVILAAALLLWSSGIFNRNVAAVTIGDETFSTTDVNFYYHSIRNSEANTANMYAQYGLPYNYDYTLADDLQMYDEERTYADYFLDEAINQLQAIKVLCDEAEAADYVLSEEGAASFASNLSSLETQITYASLMRGSSEASYIQALYGSGTSKKILEENLRRQALAGDYANHIAESFTYDDADLETYYEENSNDLDSYAFRSVFLSGVPEAQVDEETAAETEPTEEEIAAAMEEAAANAEALAQRVRNGEDFNTAAMDYLSESDRETYADPDYGYTSGILGEKLTEMFREWITEDGRSVGDVGVLEEAESGYYVVLFLDRARDDDARKNASVWSVIVTAETTQISDEDEHEEGEELEEGHSHITEAPTEAQLAAAYAKAETFQAAWAASADRSEEAFNALIPPSSETEEDAQSEEEDADALSETPEAPKPLAQILNEITSGSYGTAFDAFVFAPGQEVGAMQIVEMEEADGTISGYRFVYISDFGPILWKDSAEAALRNADYEAYFTALQELAPIARLEGLAEVGL